MCNLIPWTGSPRGRGTDPPSADGRLPDRIEQLTKLAALKDSGALTDAEFEAEKAKLLS